MKVSCGEGVASHTGPESCGDDRKVVVEALTGERAGWVLSPEILTVRDADALMSCGRQTRPPGSVRGAARNRRPYRDHLSCRSPRSRPLMQLRLAVERRK